MGLPQVGEGWASDQSPDRYLTQAVWPTLTSIDRQNLSCGSNYLWRWDTSPPKPQARSVRASYRATPRHLSCTSGGEGRKSNHPPPALMWRGLKQEHFSRGSCSKRGQICKMSPRWDCSGDFSAYSCCFVCPCDPSIGFSFVLFCLRLE